MLCIFNQKSEIHLEENTFYFFIGIVLLLFPGHRDSQPVFKLTQLIPSANQYMAKLRSIMTADPLSFHDTIRVLI